MLSSQAEARQAPDDLLLRFFRAARGVGCRISPPESMDAMRAVMTIGYSDKAALRDALLLTIAKTQEEKAALAARKVLPVVREAAGEWMAAGIDDLRVRQHQVDHPDVQEIVRHLVDEERTSRLAEHARPFDEPFAKLA